MRSSKTKGLAILLAGLVFIASSLIVEKFDYLIKVPLRQYFITGLPGRHFSGPNYLEFYPLAFPSIILMIIGIFLVIIGVGMILNLYSGEKCVLDTCNPRNPRLRVKVLSRACEEGL